MALYRLAIATIFRKKAWVIAALAVGLLPFVLPLLSTATENPVLVQPTRAQTAWTLLWISSLFWGLFVAARLGEHHNQSGLGEYFLTTGVSSTRQLAMLWLATMTFIAPLALLAAAVCLIGAMPAAPDEQSMWWATNLQYVALFLLVVSPLLALASALASRFGATAGYIATLGLAIYGLYGVGYLDMLFRLDGNSALEWAWLLSPHFHFADITNRLVFKLGAIETRAFFNIAIYLSGILLVLVSLSRMLFRTRSFA